MLEGQVVLMDPRLKTYIVEDNVTIRENLVGTLEELTCISAIGFAETEAEASRWLSDNGDQWELAIVDLFLKQGSGLGVLQACMSRRPTQKVVVTMPVFHGYRPETVGGPGVTGRTVIGSMRRMAASRSFIPYLAKSAEL